MTKGEAKKLYLRWLDEATVNGQQNSRGEVADAVDKFDYLINDALIFMAGRFPLRRIFVPIEPIKKGSCYIYEMPNDFMGLDRIMSWDNGKMKIINDYSHIPPNTYVLNKQYEALEFYYSAIPERVRPESADDTVLEIDFRAEELLPLKIAVDALCGNAETVGLSNYLEGKLSTMIMNAIDGAAQNEGSIKSIFTIM